MESASIGGLKRKRTDLNDSVTQRKKLRPNPSSQLTLTQIFVQPGNFSPLQDEWPHVPSKDYILYPEVYRTIQSHLKTYISSVHSKRKPWKAHKTLLIIGSEGSGKTYLIRSAAKSLNLPLLELNSSSLRNYSSLRAIFKEATQAFAVNYSGNKIFGSISFIDDVHIALPPDKGFYRAVNELSVNPRNPVILAGNTVPKKLLNNTRIKIIRIGNSEDKIREFCTYIGRPVNRGGFNMHKILAESLLPSVPEDSDEIIEDTELSEYHLFLDLLAVTDRQYRETEQFSTISRDYKDSVRPYVEEYLEKHSVELDCKLTGVYDFIEIARDHFLQFGDKLDHISLFQHMKRLENDGGFSPYSLRKKKTSTNKLDSLLAVRPNQFMCYLSNK